MFILFFFFNDTATTEIYTLSLHDALPICLFTQLAQRRLHRRFAGLDVPVHRLPRPRRAPPRRASQHQYLESRPARTQQVGIDEVDSNVGQVAPQRRRPSTASNRADSARARNGLVRKSSAPSSNTRTSLSSSLFAVSTMTGMSAVAGRERRGDSMP